MNSVAVIFGAAAVNLGDSVKVAAVNIESSFPPGQRFERLSCSLTTLLPYLSGFDDIIPRDALLWKLKLLKSAAAYANSRLHTVKAEVLVLASGKDNMLSSRDEAKRLKNSLQDCVVPHFKDNGHTLLLKLNILFQKEVHNPGIYKKLCTM
ncbi:hypothetical protein CMV_013755 [Castanea mollissima]|uniref:Uncharacterized protein n=1 Tax=Castanea mollissima TaxID=60419 RepID=A0A8J4R114_9ROSI|nr:hypothetical protein CMV_013755 [Castanea mollissima]